MSEDRFDARFQEMASRQQQAESEPSRARQVAINILSVVIGFIFVSVLYSLGAKIVTIGIGFDLDIPHSLITGVGLATLQLAYMSLTWSRR